MAYHRATTFITAPVLAAPLCAFVMGSAGRAEAATPTYYNNQGTFTSDIMENVTDDYSNPGYVFIQNNVQMNAVIGETDYETTGFDNLNIVSGGTYCAGCNGSFELSFTTTSVGEAAGVNGVGMNILGNDFMIPYFAYITFADGTTEDVALAPGAGYWGVSAPERIERIHFGLSGGGATMSGSFQIDDLTIGDGMDETPCGDGIATPDEECDDMGESALCDPNCTLAQCGDHTLNLSAGEICDDGGASPTCNVDCTAPICGDAVINMAAGETCDDAGETATCDLDCSAVACGDNVTNMLAGEECDDSAESPTCDADCTFVECGDGVENNTAGEYCDDGNNDDGDGCSAVCTVDEVETTTGSDESSGSSDSGSSDDGSGTTTDATVGTDGSGDGATETTPADSGGDTSSDDSGGASVSATGSVSASGGDTSGDETSGGLSGTAGSNDDSGGCSCSTDEPRRGAAWSVMALLGLGALKRRRRAA
jgi:MYXO-CTERM domain-containing protein